MTPRIAPPVSSAKPDSLEILAAIDAAVYGDVFDCAVTEHELWRYSRRPISRERLRRLLDDPDVLRGALCESNGLYCLAGREALLHLRRSRRRRALRLRRRARAVARVMQHMPFVRGLLLTGSVAAEGPLPDADVDLLVIVAPGRMSAVFALLGPVSRLLSGRLMCPNQLHLRERTRGCGPAHSLYRPRGGPGLGTDGGVEGVRLGQPLDSLRAPQRGSTQRPRPTAARRPAGPADSGMAAARAQGRCHRSRSRTAREGSAFGPLRSLRT